MGAESTVSVAVLLPDVLGTYSDAGNAVVLAQRLRWRGITARIVEVTADTDPPLCCELTSSAAGRTPPNTSPRTGCRAIARCTSRWLNGP